MKLVAQPVEVPHSDLAEVARMVLVEEDSVVVHTSGVTSTPRMLPVLSYTAVAGAHVASLLAVLLEAGRHFWVSGEGEELGFGGAFIGEGWVFGEISFRSLHGYF